ncbi:Cyclin-dependent kinase C-1 [Balamuthia mandrillaris]
MLSGSASPSSAPSGSPYRSTEGGEDQATHEWGSRSVEIFQKLEQIGEGTYGQVYKARNKYTKEIVALKKVRMDNEKEGFPITAIREIKILKELDSEHVIKLKEIVTSKASNLNNGKGSIYMVFEYMDHDLTGLMESPQFKSCWFSEGQIKCYMKQLLEGLHYCHKNNVLHRDIKGSNLLINNKGQLKLADFGLARPYNEQEKDYTNRVITLWYRPPELLLGATSYGPAIDMWSVGCILAELLWRKPVFPGRNEIDQLGLIFKLCGTPSEASWPGVSKLPWYKFKPKKLYKPRLREVFKDFPPTALDLVERLLCLDPSKRITAEQALDSDYFWTDPMPCPPSSLPKYPSSHEFQTKRRRHEQNSTNEMSKRPRMMPSASSHPSQESRHTRPSQSGSSSGSYPLVLPPSDGHRHQSHSSRSSSSSSSYTNGGRGEPSHSFHHGSSRGEQSSRSSRTHYSSSHRSHSHHSSSSQRAGSREPPPNSSSSSSYYHH